MYRGETGKYAGPWASKFGDVSSQKTALLHSGPGFPWFNFLHKQAPGSENSVESKEGMKSAVTSCRCS